MITSVAVRNITDCISVHVYLGTHAHQVTLINSFRFYITLSDALITIEIIKVCVTIAKNIIHHLPLTILYWSEQLLYNGSVKYYTKHCIKA